MTNSWRSVDYLPPLLQEEVQLWRIEWSDRPALLESSILSLSEEEHQRAGRRTQTQAREQFQVGRGCLRRLLGGVLGIDPHLVPIVAGAHNKPELRIAATDISFNVAHTRDIVLIALCRRGTVGVDVEKVDARADWLDVAQFSFTPTEIGKLEASLDPERQRWAFYRCWTQKEAVIKADGRGLALAMVSFEVPIVPAECAPVSVGPYAGSQGKTFYVTDLPLGSEAAGAVALERSDYKIHLLRFPAG